MTITSRLRSRRAQLVAGAAVLALVGSGLALTSGGSAAAGGDDRVRGWPTKFAAGDRVLSKRVARDSDRVIRLRSQEVRSSNVDADGDGDFSSGDYFVFEERLIRHGDQVGRDSIECMYNHRSFMCEGTLIRGPGTLEVAGAIFFRAGIHLPITGGTGSYRDAAGTLTVKPGGPGPGSLFIIRLVD